MVARIIRPYHREVRKYLTEHSQIELEQTFNEIAPGFGWQRSTIEKCLLHLHLLDKNQAPLSSITWFISG